MRVIRDKPDQQLLNSSVVTIGNFDGLHIGHQALLNKARELAQATVWSTTQGTFWDAARSRAPDTTQSAASGKRPVVVVTFEPLPQAWFRPDKAPARLMSIRQKLLYLAREGVSLVWVMRFNQALAAMEPDEFVQRVLVDVLDAGDVVVGDDFHYGRHRQGNAGTLRMAGERSGFQLSVVSSIDNEATRVSSSAIRESLAAGKLQDAKKLLGRPFRTEGRIIKGQQLGRTLGYPTANMKLAAVPSPIQGVFAIRARLCDERGGGSERELQCLGDAGSDRSEHGWRGVDEFEDGGVQRWRDGVASLGTRPAVSGNGFLIEVHLFDFDGDLYGRRMEVEYIEKLRDEAHFTQLDDLVAQMREDERLAREILLSKAGTPALT